MSRWLPTLARTLFLLVIGIVLFYAPWTTVWDNNFFLSHYAWIAALGHNDFLRGAISGVGLADVWLGASDLHRMSKSPHSAAPTR